MTLLLGKLALLSKAGQSHTLCDLPSVRKPVATKRLFFRSRITRFISRSDTLLSIETERSARSTLRRIHFGVRRSQNS